MAIGTPLLSGRVPVPMMAQVGPEGTSLVIYSTLRGRILPPFDRRFMGA